MKTVLLHNEKTIHLSTNEREKQQQFDAIYRQSYSLLLAFVKKMCGCDTEAEDIVQNVFIKLWTTWESQQQIRDIDCFLGMIARNLCIDAHRREGHKKKMHKTLRSKTIWKANFTEDIIDSNEMHRRLQEAISKLTISRKRVFVLGKLEGWTREEISKVLGVSPNTVKETMQMALRDITAYLEQHIPIKKKGKLKKSTQLWLSEMRLTA